jgi:hypothetical protein
LAQLWSTYRTCDVHVTFIPNNTGAGAQTATVTAIDPAGAEAPLELADDPVVAFSRLRSMKISPSLAAKTIRFNYLNWLS